MPLPVARITFGIRFGPRWRIRDNIGAIVDSVLRDKGTPFGPGVFTRNESFPDEHRLFNPDTKDILRVSERDVILTKSIESGELDEIQVLVSQFEEYIVEPIREIGKIRDIHRYGILFELAECSHQLKRPLTQHYLPDEPTDHVTGPRDLLLRFSRHLQTVEGHLRKGVNDYRNVIYTLQQDEKGDAHIQVDYQEYFVPPLDGEDWKKKPFTTFAEAGTGYFDNTFSKWLTSLLKFDEAA